MKHTIKSRKYGLNMPVGTWMVSMKVNNEDVWKDYVKTGKVKGFSIEGYFTDKVAMSIIQKEEDAAEVLLEIADSIETGKLNLKTYGDYGSGVRNNAKRGIELNKKVNNRCATSVGKIRAQQLARGEKLREFSYQRLRECTRIYQEQESIMTQAIQKRVALYHTNKLDGVVKLDLLGVE